MVHSEKWDIVLLVYSWAEVPNWGMTLKRQRIEFLINNCIENIYQQQLKNGSEVGGLVLGLLRGIL